MSQTTDFAEAFARLAGDGGVEETTNLGGVNVRLVRVPGGGPGSWGSHDATTEIVIVWTGDFTVDFRDHSRTLASGQCCVVPVGAEHRGTSMAGAEVVLFQQAP